MQPCEGWIRYWKGDVRSMAEIKYIINLPPITKKNSQQILMHPKTKRPFIMPSKKYKEYESKAGVYLRPKPPRPISCGLNVKCLFYMPTRRAVDLNNLLEAATDVMVKAQIIEDDNCRIVVGHDGSRVLYDKDHPRTEIIITKMPVEPVPEQMSFRL